MPPSREVKMKDTQVWSDVYPTAATFKWSAVPLSVRMGYPVRRGIPPHKLGNAELMKVRKDKQRKISITEVTGIHDL